MQRFSRQIIFVPAVILFFEEPLDGICEIALTELFLLLWKEKTATKIHRNSSTYSRRKHALQNAQKKLERTSFDWLASFFTIHQNSIPFPFMIGIDSKSFFFEAAVDPRLQQFEKGTIVR